MKFYFIFPVIKKKVAIIREVLNKLPNEIYQFINKNVEIREIPKYRFYTHVWGFHFPTESSLKHVIFLDPLLWVKRKTFIKHVIAHEFAHAYLYDIFFNKSQKVRTKSFTESDVNKLVNSWGFRPVYTDEVFNDKG